MKEYYVLRYVDGADLKHRRHTLASGRYATWDDAEAVRQRAPHPQRELLEVQGPRRDTGVTA